MLLAPDKEHKKVFPYVRAEGFCNGAGLKDYLVRAALPKTNETGKCGTCVQKTCLVCNSIRTIATFTTEACRETSKTQLSPLNCNAEKLLYLLECKVFSKVPYV